MAKNGMDRGLWAAAEFGDAKKLAAELESGADPLAKGPEGMTALMMAAYAGHVQCVELLLPVSSMSAKCKRGYGPLGSAVRGGKADCAKLIAERGGASERTMAGWTPLMLAVGNGDEQCMEAVLPWSDVAALDESGRNVLMVAASCFGEGLIGRAAQWVDVRAVDKAGRSVLLIAASHGKTEAARQLIARGCDPLEANGDGETALMAAVKCGNLDCALFFLPISDVAAKDGEGKDALHWAQWRAEHGLSGSEGVLAAVASHIQAQRERMELRQACSESKGQAPSKRSAI